MVHVLGVNLPDRQLARFALTHFYGIGPKVSHRLCARLQIHDKCRIRDLTANQITSLTAFLSSPSTAPPVPRFPLASPDFLPPPPSTPVQQLKAPEIPKDVKAKPSGRHNGNRFHADPLQGLKIETDLRREVRENIAHQRMIGSYVGKRHAMGLPVRGQNTQTNASTARKLNRIERYA
ncbi:S13-like H2TH domain-containing protein [Gloeophyllum trabeum ATCC 11539]|uniref:Small ribosomal subunit protein uS13m n=1 Tax=Gloeophyllum trabeum (strain ATCC 11539 / FP-39264 / Madison 617) TaxID=670483 RepID=S7QFX6_GLOTA|nr:S13-like H2TH domain-containing protein [Gloeophyllum trabeum ATCC 11539]EPQ58327.1 S13-like H2TH domain-containing protein [Gloeophyllum trabeum ATCC 11539]